VTCRETITFRGLPIIEGRSRAYAPVDPKHATELFIRGALIDDGLKRPPAVLAGNRKLLRRAQGLAARLRDPSLAVDDEALFAAYASVLLPGATDAPVASAHDLRRWCKEHGETALRLHEDQLIDVDAWLRADAGFPEHVDVAGARIPLHYVYAPGHDDDGVSLRVSEAQLVACTALPWDRLIPGLIGEVVEAYLKALPKEQRRRCIPVAETAVELQAAIADRPGTVATALAEALRERLGEPVRAPELGSLPPHLLPRLVVVDQDGAVRFTGRDPRAALTGIGIDDPVAPLRAAWDTVPGRTWPGAVPVEAGAGVGRGYPALVRERDEQARVAARRTVFASREAAAAWHGDGVRALLEAVYDDDLSMIAASGAGDLDRLLREQTGTEAGAIRRQLAELALINDAAAAECRSDEAYHHAYEQALANLRRCAADVDGLLRALASRAQTIRKRLKRGLSGMLGMSAAGRASADLHRLFAPGWPRRLGWDAVGRMPLYLDAIIARLDAAERGGATAQRQLAEHARLCALVDEAFERVDGRQLAAVGCQALSRQVNEHLEELLLARTTGANSKIGEPHLRDGARRIAAAVSEQEAAERRLRAELVDVRPALERYASGDERGERLLANLDRFVAEYPDLAPPCDLVAQHGAGRRLLERVRGYLTG
jgi:ATP-dependent helicase HrpA